MGRPLRKPLYNHIEHSHLWMPSTTPQKIQNDNFYSLDEMSSPSATQHNAFPPATSPKIDMPQSQPESTMYLRPQSWDPMMSDIQTDNFSTTMDDLFSFLGPPPGSNGHDLLQGFLDQSTTASGDPDVYPLTPRDSAQQSPGVDKSLISPESASHKDTLFALSKLNHFLIECHLLLQNQSCPPPWRVSMADPNLLRDSKLDENPVGTILRSTAEFVDIVKTWTKSTSQQTTQSDKTKDQGIPVNFYNFHPAKYTLNKPTILMMITTYLLFVRMFDVIFTRLIFAFREFPNEVVKVRFEPGFKLGGFSLPQGFLYFKIIIQAFEHHLELIESSLGLPAEYRVSVSGYQSERQQDSSGVFDNPRYRSLLKAVMMEELEDDNWGDGNAERNNHGEVFRLRENVTKIKELLQGL